MSDALNAKIYGLYFPKSKEQVLPMLTVDVLLNIMVQL